MPERVKKRFMSLLVLMLGTFVLAFRPAETPQAGGAASSLGRLLQGRTPKPASAGEIDEALVRAERLAASGKRQEAIELLSGITHRFPEAIEARNNLAALLAEAGELDRAEGELRAALGQDTRLATVYSNLIRLHEAQAARSYARALGKKPREGRDPPRLARLGSVPGPPLISTSTRERPAAPAAHEEPARPASAPVATGAPTGAVGPDLAGVLAAVKGWATAWSSRDVPAYLACYSGVFRPAGGVSREAWGRERRERILGARRIEVSLARQKVSPLEGGQARVRFRQTFKSELLNRTTGKELVLRKEGDGWKILTEEVEK